MGTYRLIHGDDEDRMDESSDSQPRLSQSSIMPPPPLPSSQTAPRGDEGERQEVPDSPDLEPVDSSGLPLVSPLENRRLSFSDYMMGSTASITPAVTESLALEGMRYDL